MRNLLKTISAFLLLTALVWLVIFRENFNLLEELDEIRSTTIPAQESLNMDYHNSRTIDSLMALKDYSNAKRFIEFILDSTSSRRDNYLLELGIVYFEEQRFDSALYLFRKSVKESYGDNLRAREWKAFAHYHLGDCDSARLEAGIAYEKNPSLKESRDRIAIACDED